MPKLHTRALQNPTRGDGTVPRAETIPSPFCSFVARASSELHLADSAQPLTKNLHEPFPCHPAKTPPRHNLRKKMADAKSLLQKEF